MLFIPVIKNPMDLGTMQKKLRSGQYKTKNQFAHDLNLIWDNCLVYNASPTHPLRRNATFMRRKANHLLEFLSDKHESKDLLAQWQLSSSTTSNMPRMSSDVASTSADILSTSSTGTFKGSGGNNNNNNNNISDSFNNSKVDNSSIQSTNVNQEILIPKQQVEDLEDYIQKIDDEDLRQMNEEFLDNFKASLKKYDKENAKKWIGYIKNTVNAPIVQTILENLN
mgnify:CR=1 FL=1